jgi:hypothetical protein
MNRYSMSEFDSSSVRDSETGDTIPLHRATIQVVHLRKLVFAAEVDGQLLLFKPHGDIDIQPDEATERRVAIIEQACPHEQGAVCQLVVAIENRYSDDRIIDCSPLDVTISEA